MSRRDDKKGYLQIDETGRIYVLGSGLRKTLGEMAGYYTHLPSDASLLHFQRAQSVPTYDEFRDPIILQGDIAAMGSTVEVINFVTSSQLSGNLVFVSDDIRKCLYFKNGEVRGAASNRAEDRLGEVMYRFGALTREALDAALEECRRIRRPFGNFLLDRGIIAQTDLYKFVRKQVEETFYSVLLIAEGDFYLTRFDVDSLPSPLSLNAQTLLMEGLRRMDEMTYFRQQIPDLSTRIAIGRNEPSLRSALSDKEQVLLSALEQPLSVRDLINSCRFGEFDTTKQLFHLLQAGYVQVLEPEGDDLSLDGDPQASETATMIDTFNSVFQRIYQAIARHGRQDALEQGLETFLQFYGFVELFQGVTFDSRGRLDKAQMLQNLGTHPADTREGLLSQALNELLFFEMFAAREWLERDEQQELQKIINQLFIDIG
ncbi:MAG: DUF4388 domain-containing protein [Myxococcales bacterium]|nr:DUF4388 domain-containing protein [Myxococcales bacterium]